MGRHPISVAPGRFRVLRQLRTRRVGTTGDGKVIGWVGGKPPVRGKPQEEAGFRSFVSRPELGTRSGSLAVRAGRDPALGVAGAVGVASETTPPRRVFKSGRARSRRFSSPSRLRVSSVPRPR